MPPFPPLGPTVYNDRQWGQICNSSEGGESGRGEERKGAKEREEREGKTGEEEGLGRNIQRTKILGGIGRFL